MLKFYRNCNGVQSLSFIHGFRHFLRFSTSSTEAEGNPSFVNYLVKCLGFSNKQALSTSTKLARRRQIQGAKKVSDFNFSENADSVIAYLKRIGLEQSHIRNIIVSAPNILLCNLDKTLKPKVENFLKLGFSVIDFAEVTKAKPTICSVGESTIVPAVQALRETLGSDCHVLSILKCRGIRFTSIVKTLKSNVALLRDYGIPLDSIRKQLLMTNSPYWLFRQTEDFQDAVIRVEVNFGIPRDAPPFMTGVRLLNSYREDTIELKRRIFMSCGWTESDVAALFRSYPLCLSFSEATIREKIGYLMKELGYEPNYLISRTALLTCSLENRIVPRHKALQFLKEKGLIKMDCSLYAAICLSESKFLKRYVLPFKEVHEVYAKLAGISLKRLALELSKLKSNVAG